MKFTKMHGLGNDFVLLDLRQGGEPLPASRAVELCDRHRGIGADGVLTLLPAADGVRFLVQNADGSVPEMCGNGARCAALWVATLGGTRTASAVVTLLTDAGPRPCRVEAQRPDRGTVEVGMGIARLEPAKRLGGFDALPVSMGNPHRAIFVEGADRARLQALCVSAGPGLCRDENANIEFAARAGPLSFEVAVWERGAGATLACGTGACAVAAAAVARGEARRGDELTIHLPGGPLAIRLLEGDQVQLRGPAQLVFSGELPASP